MRSRLPQYFRFAPLAAVLSIMVAIAIGTWPGGGAARTSEAVSAPATPPVQTATPGMLEGPKVIVASELPPSAVVALGPPAIIVTPRRSEPATDPPGAAGVRSPQPNALSGGAGVGPIPMAAPAPSTTAFEGLDDIDNFIVTGALVSPPDPQIAVGPNHVFEMVNITGRIFTKTGTTVSTFSLASFFGVPSGYSNFDPKVIYDALSGRWFASYVSSIDNPSGSDEGRLHLAISQTSDPTGAWNVYYLSYIDVFPDDAGIGVTNDKFTISSNLFDIDGPPGTVALGCSLTTGFCGEQTIVVQKSDVIAGLAAQISAFSVNPGRFTVRPAHSLSSASDQYLTTFNTSFTNVLTVIRVTGTPAQANVTEAVVTDLAIQTQASPPPAMTAGSGTIDSGDRRMLETVWRNNSLWNAASAACLPAGDTSTRSCAHLIEVETVGTPSVVQDMLFGGPVGNYWSWPAIRTDASGNLYVSLTRTNTSIFAEARVAGRLATDPLNTMSGSSLLRAGEIVHTSGRWGDYLGAAVDPSDPSCVWLVGEYAKNTIGLDWGTT